MKNTKQQIILLTNHDDWEGLYVDGKLVCQGHRIRLTDLAGHLGVDFKTQEFDFKKNYDAIALPENLSDVEKIPNFELK